MQPTSSYRLLTFFTTTADDPLPYTPHTGKKREEMASDANMLKASSLLLLSLQNFAYGLLLPVARKADENGNVFFGPTAVVTTELIKILISLCGLAREGQARAVQRRTGSVDWTDEKIHQAAERATADRDVANSSLARQAGFRVAAIRDLVFQGSSFKLLLPAVLFVIQNNLQIQSASYLGECCLSL